MLGIFNLNLALSNFRMHTAFSEMCFRIKNAKKLSKHYIQNEHIRIYMGKYLKLDFIRSSYDKAVF